MSLFRFAEQLHAWVRQEGGQVGSGRFERSSGGQCATVYLRPAVPVGTVIVLHATGNDRYFPFLQLYKSLFIKGFAVFAGDLDGHGRCSTHRLSAAALNSLVPEAIAHARQAAGEGPYYLLGQSLGALLGLRYLAARPEAESVPLRAAVWLSAPLSGQLSARPFWPELLAVRSGAFWRAAYAYGIWELLPAVGAFKRAAYPLRFAAGEGGLNVSSYVGFVDQLVAQSQALWQAPVRLPPCLFLYGGADRLTPAAQAESIVRRLGGVLEVVPKETHFTLALHAQTIERVGDWLLAAAVA